MYELHLAILKGKDISSLINENNVNELDKKECSPLHLASAKGQVNNIEVLLDKGANINAYDRLGNSPLHVAILNNQKDAVAKLVDRGAELGTCNNDGRGVVHQAAYKGVDMLRLVVRNDDHLHERDFKNGETALHIASRLGNNDAVDFLTNFKNSPISAKNAEGNTSLSIAKQLGHDDVADTLVNKGADTKTINKEPEVMPIPRKTVPSLAEANNSQKPIIMAAPITTEQKASFFGSRRTVMPVREDVKAEPVIDENLKSHKEAAQQWSNIHKVTSEYKSTMSPKLLPIIDKLKASESHQAKLCASDTISLSNQNRAEIHRSFAEGLTDIRGGNVKLGCEKLATTYHGKQKAFENAELPKSEFAQKLADQTSARKAIKQPEQSVKPPTPSVRPPPPPKVEQQQSYGMQM